MAAKAAAARELASEIAYLTRVLKAPTLPRKPSRRAPCLPNRFGLAISLSRLSESA